MNYFFLIIYSCIKKLFQEPIIRCFISKQEIVPSLPSLTTDIGRGTGQNYFSKWKLFKKGVIMDFFKSIFHPLTKLNTDINYSTLSLDAFLTVARGEGRVEVKAWYESFWFDLRKSL